MPISGSDSSCPFCGIAAGTDEEARVVYWDDCAVAFFPTEPATLGHTLLIPRRHVRDIYELDPETAARLGQAAVKLANAIRVAVQPDGLNVIQSNGAAATQTVLHVHIHLVPRWADDKVGPIWPPETHYTENQKDRAWEAIRKQSRLLMAG